MAGAPSNEATFSVKLDGNADAVAQRVAGEMENMRRSIGAGQSALKQMNAQLKALAAAGESAAEVKADLAKKIEAEKQALAQLTVQQIKATELNKRAIDHAKQLAAKKKALSDQAKADKEKQDKLNASAAKAGGPVVALRDKLNGLKEAFSTSQGRSALLAAGVVTLTVAVVAAAAAFAAGAVSLGAWIIKSADAARSAGLLRQAAMGASAQWGKNAGEQVDALALKVPTAKAQIDALGNSLAKSRIGGQIWVDTLNAVTQASAALGDEAGGKLREFVERGRLMGRMQINPLEMIGSGIDFQDVAKELAKSMKVGVKEAQAALFEGRVKLGDGAAAIRAAVEKKFGGINLRQMLSLENLSKKLGEAFTALTRDVDLEPILQGLKEMSEIFSLSTESGQALKQIVTIFGKELSSSFATTTPLAKKFVYGLIIGAQELTIGYLKARNELRKMFADSDLLKNVDGMKIALQAGKTALYGMAAAAVIVVGAFAAVAATVGAAWAALTTFTSLGERIGTELRNVDWKALGKSVVEGLADGLKMGASLLVAPVVGLASTIKKAFTTAMEIRSPSRVAKGWGKDIDAGLEGGIEDHADGPQRAVSNLLTDGPKSPKGGASAGASVTVNVTINVNGNDAKQIAAQLQQTSLLEQLTKTIADACQGAGIPVPG